MIWVQVLFFERDIVQSYVGEFLYICLHLSSKAATIVSATLLNTGSIISVNSLFFNLKVIEKFVVHVFGVGPG